MSTKKSDSDGTYFVGPGKPTREHQWKPGQSGNPAGRPPKLERIALPVQLNRDVLERLDRPMTANIGNEIVELPTIRAIMEVQIRKALSGHAPSARFWVNMYVRVLESIAQREPEARVGVEERLDAIANESQHPGNYHVLNDAARYLRRKYITPRKREKRVI